MSTTRRDYQTQFAVKTLKIADIKPNPCQGGRRTAPTKLKRIKQSFIDIGCKIPPLLDSNLVIIDGHRRVEALKALGAESIKCMVLEEALAPDTLISVNTPTLAFSSRDKLEAWAQFPKNRKRTLEAMDSNCRRRITGLVDIFGADRLTVLVNQYQRLSPTLHDVIREIRAAQFRYGDAEAMLEPVLIGHWVLKFNFQSKWFEARKVLTKRRVEKLTKSIVEGEEMTLEEYWAAK